MNVERGDVVWLAGVLLVSSALVYTGTGYWKAQQQVAEYNARNVSNATLLRCSPHGLRVQCEFKPVDTAVSPLGTRYGAAGSP